MNRLVQAVSVSVWAWRGAGAAMGQASIWLPLLIVAGVQALALSILLLFHHPALLPVGLPLVRLLGGDQATHYPQLYFTLPLMFFKANLVIGALVESIAGGVAVLLFARAFGFPIGAPPWKEALRRAPALITAGVVLSAVLLGVALSASLVPRDLMLKHALARWGLRGADLIIFTVVTSLLAYVAAWIVLMGRRVGAAIRDSIRLAARTFLPTLIVVGVPAALFFPLAFTTGRGAFIAGKLRPELTAGLLGLNIVVGTLLAFVVFGAITRLFLWRVEASR